MPHWVTQKPVVEHDWTSELSVLKGHTGQVDAVAFSPTDNLVVSIFSDKTTRLWDCITGTERFRFEERESYCCTAFSPDGKSVALGSSGGLISIREFGKGSVIDLKGHEKLVSHVAFSRKSSSILASISHDCTLRIWNIDERRTIHVLRFPVPSAP